MMKQILISILVVFFAFSLAAQDTPAETEAPKSDIPEKVQLSFDGLMKTRTSNDVYSLKKLDTYFYVLQKSVFVNVLFTAELDGKIGELDEALKTKAAEARVKYDAYVAEMEKKTAEENKKIEEKNKKIKDEAGKLALKTFEKPEPPEFRKRNSYHNLYLRVMKDGVVHQKFKSELDYNGTDELEYFSFGLILEPGTYDLLMVVDAYDHSEDGTLIAELEVPKMTLMDIAAPGKKLETTRPVFYKTVSTLMEAEQRFTVVKNNYQIGIVKQKFVPYVGDEYKFNSGDTPILTFFLQGAAMAQKNPPWDLTAVISIFSGKKKIATFKEIKLENPYFFQPVKIAGAKDAELEPGSYTLRIEFTDHNARDLKGSLDIPFEVIR